MENLNDVQKICIDVFQIVAKTTSIFVLPLFMGQIAFSNVSGSGDKVFSSLKGVLLYFTLVAGFPLILSILFAIPESFLPSFTTFNSMTSSMSDSTWSGMLPLILSRAFEVILSVLYWIVYYLHIFFMLIMCSMAPIVFLGGTILGIGIGIEIFMGLLIIGSSWPIIWYGFDQVHAALTVTQQDEFALRCLELLLILSKGIAPVAFAMAAIKSPAGKAISGAAKTAAAATGKVIPSRAPATPMSVAPQLSSKKSSLPPTTDASKRFLSQTGPRGPIKKAIDRLQKAKDELMKPKEGEGRENTRKRNS